MNTVQIVSTIGVLGIVVWTSSQSRSTPTALRPAVPVPQACEELEETLSQLKRAWNPRVQVRVLDEAKERIARLRPPLLWWLGRYDPPMLAEAVTLAERLELAEARPLLLEIARYGRAEMQPLAVTAAARLAPLSDDESRELFESEAPAVRAAAAEACVAADHADTLLDLLFDPDASVRSAASEAIPSNLTKASRARLVELAKTTDGGSETHLVRAVGRLDFGADSEALLLLKLRSPQATTRAVALDALTQSGRLRNPAAVWSLIEDPSTAATDRSRAFYCLERTQAATLKQMRAQIPLLENSRCKYHAARCLLSLGAREGAALLVEILESEDADEALRGESRLLLSQLTGLSSESSTTDWKDWLRGGHRIPVKQLTASSLTFDS